MEDRAEEICADIAALSKSVACCEPAFCFTLVPDGTPPYDKAMRLGGIFSRFRDILARQGVHPGILVQATMGHGWKPDSVSPYQKLRNKLLSYPYIHCPLDPGFREYASRAVGHLAGLEPAFMMMDDDFRMLTGRFGCFCELHVKEFNHLKAKSLKEDTMMMSNVKFFFQI